MPEEPTLRRRLPAFLASLATIVGAQTVFADEAPHLEWGKRTRCLARPDGVVVRVQCDDDARPRACLVAPNELASGGPLTRTGDCSTSSDPRAYEKLVKKGVRLVPAIAEAPPGFARSAAGRAFQTKFDLYDRFYVGAGWAPTYEKPAAPAPAPRGLPFGRAQIELGFEASVLSPKGRSRHDFKVLEGAAAFGDFQLHGLLFAYDYQHEHRRPAFWLSTFFGKPRVYPIPIPLGFGFRLLDVEDRPPSLRDSLDIEMGEAHLSWSPLVSHDMYTRLRLEAGADTGKYWADRRDAAKGFGTGRWYVGFTSAIRSRVSLGQGGLHYLFADVTYTRPALLAQGDEPLRMVNRVTAQLAYEGVFLAINDQPLSLRLAALGSARDDAPASTRGLEVGATAGLRFSFWAPPRVPVALPELEDP
jgi:hypothetical protein